VPSAPFDLECVGLRKSFGDVPALRGVDLEVEPGRFFALVGPSGCGKSTLLRIVGGHEVADAGTVRLRGNDVSGVPPEKRPVHTVFQHFALFPHLSVRENVAFALRMAGMPRPERTRRADEALALVRLAGHGDRSVAALSGGEKQRVALARAVVPRPAVLLLDEPLGALDLQLRRAMQDELRDLHRRVGLTFLHVTHDQEEAFRLADRVAILRAGKIVQQGAPEEVYRRPTTPFVASFLGVANVLAGAAVGRGDVFRTRGGIELAAARPVPRAAWAALREERLLVSPAGAAGEAGAGAVSGVVADTVFLGATTRVSVDAGPARERLEGRAADGAALRAGDRVTLRAAPEDVVLLESEGDVEGGGA
jgi:ABC-type Fe3+/spermidine/putrescine transport system ATPase subunit